MPDPAIEAYKAGIPYTEPTGKGTRKARISYEWVVDPNDPTAQPRQRRVIEPASSGGLRKWWKGGDKATYQPVPMQATPVQSLPAQSSNGWPTAPIFSKKIQAQPRYLPRLDPLPDQQWSTPPVLLQPTPLPPNFNDMPWTERRYWTKAREEQMKAIKMMQKAAEDQKKAQEKERKVKLKVEEKRLKREMKAREKELKYMRKNPYRPMPLPSQYPSATAPPAPTAPPPDPLSFMLHSTGDEFGVRRPFNAPGLPRSLGGPAGQAGWPMMSRTMTLAVQDLSREERVHAIQSGRAWAPNW